jgi:uncharacterized protein (DUF305 family)
MKPISQSQRLALAIGLAALAAACSKSDKAATDSAAGAAATPTAATPSSTDTTKPMDHSAMANMNRTPAKDADDEFLRMMSDHHEGLIQMASEAMTKASNSTAQGDAHRLHTKQADEQKKMLGMAESMYGDKVTPMVMPSNKAMMDSLQAKTGAEYDRAFYRNVIAHHQEGIKMVDDMMPKLAKPEIKQMAERMKSDQQKEIAEFEKKSK